MPRLDGVGAMRALRDQLPGARVIVLTSFLDEAKLMPALRAGAAGYLLKNAPPKEIARAVRAAHAGETLLDPVVASRLVEALTHDEEPLDRLTPREREVLDLIGRGFANKRIARELGVSEKTVKTHVGHVLAKLDVSDRTQAAVVGGARGAGRTRVLGPIATGKCDRVARSLAACPPPSSPEPPEASDSPSPARSSSATGASSSTPAARTALEATAGLLDNVSAIPGDVTDPHHRRALVEAAGVIDLLVNNASLLGPSPQPTLVDYPLDTLREVYEVNVIAPLALIQTALPQLAPDATVVNVSSDAAVEPYDGWGGYGSSKAALDQLTAILAAEHLGLRIYAVDPGDMRTQMHQEAFPGEDISDRPPPEDERARPAHAHRRRLPSGRYRAADLAAVRT